MTLSRSEYTERLTFIMSAYEAMLKDGEFAPGQFALDGKRIVSIIEALAALIAEMSEHVKWDDASERILPYG